MIKDILLIALADDPGEAGLDLAAAVTANAGASLRCMGLGVLPDGYLGFSESAETVDVAQARREQRAQFDEFDRLLKRRSPPIPSVFVAAYPKTIVQTIASAAHQSDAIVVRAPALSHDQPHGAIIEAALFEGGAPVFVAPLHWRASALGQRVLVCWDNSASAARAAHAALNFVAPDAQLVVVQVADAAHKDDASGRAFAAHLARATIRAEWRSYDRTEADTASTLDHIAREISADLIVMGGYRHSPARQSLFGGVTRALLHAPRLPLLLSH